MHEVLLSIGGEACAASGGRRFERRNPLDGSVATRAAAASADDALRAVSAAQNAFRDWSRSTPAVRRQLLMSAAAALEARRGQFVAAMAAEMGASAHWAGFNVELSVGILQEAAGLTTQIAGEVIPSNVPGSVSLAVRQPAGVVLSMAPWNAPVILATRAIALPLACGNTVVLKGSEVTPRTHELVAQCFIDAGCPPGVVNFIANAPADAADIVESLIAHPAVRRVNFTGSTRVGRIVAQACARHLKPSLLELGGKGPFIVLDDADIDAAVSAAAFGAFANSGQICMSTERIIVDTAVADEFAERFAARAGDLTLGDPRTGPAVLGSVVDQATVERCNAFLDDALAKGARLLCGGPADTTLMHATVLDHVTPAMRIYDEESFGPVKGIVRVDGVAEAVRVANDTEYGLAAAVFGRDINRAWQVASQIQSGICHINSATVHDEAQVPFGGVKGSGWGRFGGQQGVQEFTDLRWITLQTLPLSYPF